MNAAQLNTAFLGSLDNRTFIVLMQNIANHYGINETEAFEEVTDSEAENIMDYVTGNIRPAISLLFNKFKAGASL